MRNKFPTYISEKTLKHYYAFTNAGVPAIWTPPPSTKLSVNIILTSVLVKMDNTLRSSAYKSMFLIQNIRIDNAFELASRRMFLLAKGKWARI